MNRLTEVVKLFMHDMPVMVQAVLYISLITWGWFGYKQVEGVINPVVKNFSIEQVIQEDEGTRIAGSMNKVRDCNFDEIVAYSDDRLVDIKFVDVRNVVSRVEGTQAWGWWLVIPPVDSLKLYARHTCSTGRVLTKLYDGEI